MIYLIYNFYVGENNLTCDTTQTLGVDACILEFEYRQNKFRKLSLCQNRDKNKSFHL